MWSDNETKTDLIGFRVHADLIRALVTDPTMLPITVGIFGDWGGGKTSIMRMLQQDLDPLGEGEQQAEGKEKGEEGVAVLYFNGWQFEGYDDAKAAILSSMLTQLMEHKRFGPKVRKGAKRLLKSINWMRIAGAVGKHVLLPAVSAYLTGGASIPASCATWIGGLLGEGVEAADEAEAPDEAPSDEVDWEAMLQRDPGMAAPLAIRTFRHQFRELLKESDIKSLVVLVDDLDRCTPETLIGNLEAIKLFLSVPGTAFVIGADPRIVEHAIRTRYRTAEVASEAGEGAPADRLVQDYLEKLVQVPYRLPQLSPAEVETYMVLLFCRKELSDEAFAKVVAACEAQRAEDRYSTFGPANVTACLGETELGEALSEYLSFCNSTAPLITDGLKGNPRQVKRFLNALWLRKKLAEVAKLEHVHDRELVKLMVLEYTEPDRFQELFLWQSSQGGFPGQLQQLEAWATAELEGGEAMTPPQDLPKWTAKTETRRWLASKPTLAEVDLRDYFWIARDRLQGTLSGLAPLPPVVRRLLGEVLDRGSRAKAVTAVIALSVEHQAALLGALHQQVVRDSASKDAHDAFRALVEAEMPGSAEGWAAALTACSSRKIPAAVGSALAQVAKAREPSGGPLTTAARELTSNKGTMVARALESAGMGG